MTTIGWQDNFQMDYSGTKPFSKVFTGARCIFQLHSEQTGSSPITIAWGTGVSGSVEFAIEPAEVLGRYTPVEFTPMGMRAEFQVSVLRVVDEKKIGYLYEMGLLPQLPDPITNESGFAEALVNIFPNTHAYIIDKFSGKKLFTFKRARPQNLSFDIRARGLITFNVRFQAIAYFEG